MNQDITRFALIGIQAEIVTLEARLAELREQQARMLKAVGRRTSPKQLAKATSAQDGSSSPVKAARKRRGEMSPEGRERIREAQKARWARVRAAQSVTAPTPDPELADQPIEAGGAVAAAANVTRKKRAKNERKSKEVGGKAGRDPMAPR